MFNLLKCNNIIVLSLHRFIEEFGEYLSVCLDNPDDLDSITIHTIENHKSTTPPRFETGENRNQRREFRPDPSYIRGASQHIELIVDIQQDPISSLAVVPCNLPPYVHEVGLR